jgi:hypothetical protein
MNQQSDRVCHVRSGCLGFHPISGQEELTATRSVSMLSYQRGRERENERVASLSGKSKQLTKESLRSTVKELCGIRVFCRDTEPPGHFDIVSVHGRR